MQNKQKVLEKPGFTTDGMLPKCRRREKGKIKLYKGGTGSAPDTGNEQYSEYYAAQVHKQAKKLLA